MTNGKPERLVGQVVDGYRILEIAGRGGMGVVFKAVNIGLAKTVALKMIDPAMAANERFQQSFQSEARALARTDTSNIVRVYDLRSNEHGLFIVMEFVDGETVADVIETRGGRLPWREGLPIIKQALAALDHAHGVGVVHRDIKPRNLMIQARGTVKVTDFGLAKVERTDSESTVLEGEWEGGTIPYMAPEQVRGQEVDHRADIYALGMMFYEILTGHRPFLKADRFSSLEAMVRDQPPSPLKFVHDLPTPLVEIVLKAVEKGPERRFQSADEMLDALNAFESGAPEATAKQSSSAVRKWSLVLTGTAALALGIAFALGRAGSSDLPRLSVKTTPSGAAVSLAGTMIGTTPLDDVELEETATGSSPLRIELEGYKTVDTLVSIEAASEVVVDVPLLKFPAETTGELEVLSEPVDAIVYVDGVDVGRTPVTIRIGEVPATVRIEKRGYEPWIQANVTLASGGRLEVNAELQPTLPPSTSRARVTLRAEPSGTVAWRGTTGSNSQTFSMPTGNHTVTFSREGISRDTTVNIRGSERVTLTCFFEHEIRVNSLLATDGQQFISGSVTVNGETVGETPAQLTYGPGVYTIGVTRFGYQTLGPERTIEIRPAFERKSHAVIMTLSEQ